jgi:hypothetical protein
LIAVLFVASGWWVFMLQVPTPIVPDLYVGRGGAVLTMSDTMLYYAASADRNSFNLSRWNSWAHYRLVHGQHGETIRERTYLIIPLYAVFVAVGLPTLLVWRFVPKFPRGHCRRCGYNLKGLTEARCPECGTGFAMQGRRR